MLGANIGFFALYVHWRMSGNEVTTAVPGVPPPLRFLAVEPIAENLALLRKNVKLYGLACAVYNCSLDSGVDAERSAPTFRSCAGEPKECRAYTPDGSQKVSCKL